MKNVMKTVMITDTWAYYQIHTTSKSTELLKGWRTVIRWKNKNLKGLLDIIRVTKIDEILNIKAITNKIEQILEKFEKKKKDCKIYHINHSENLPSTNYCWGLILKAMKNTCD